MSFLRSDPKPDRPVTPDTPTDSATAAAPPSAGPASAATGTPGGQSATGTGDARPAARASDPLMTLKLKPKVIEVLSTIFDPEIPVNIYELGLVYEITADAEGKVDIQMTLTAPGCPAAQSLPIQVQERVGQISEVADVRVDIVWDPPWTQERMSETARLQLGIL